jgi:nitrogen fixation/metabolism regulation signal transduction histidine kinase
MFHKLRLEYTAREQLLLAMIEHSATGFISIDEHGDFDVMNKEARAILDCELTSNLSRLKGKDASLYKLIRGLSTGNQQCCKLITKEGTRTIKVSSAELKYSDKAFTLIALQDIQDEIEAKEMESWQKLMRIMNHEIMNTIAPIISASRSLKPIYVHNNKPVAPSDLNQKKIRDTISGLEIIENMGRGLKSFVGHYRKLSKIPEPTIKQVDPVKWIQTLRQLFLDLISGEHLSIDVRISGNTGPLRIDEKLFNQVMMNLVRNAWEAPEGEHKKHIWVNLGLNDQHKTCIRVINNGQPIPREIQDQIFIPFFTTKDKGNGIGLFLSRIIVNAHSGSIAAFTRSNGDTVFEITL